MGEEMYTALTNFDGACRRTATFGVNLMRFADQSMTDCMQQTYQNMVLCR
jgi:hypothetical protein